ncbi:MAG: acetyl-CoA hydrolase/transferase C-terminal domain-containing protein, partial [Rikenellaceae bacterium]
INYFCRHDEPLHAAHFTAPTAEESAIAKYCASVIEDGACLQMGIGSIPNAVLSELKGHKNMGVHTEMFADGIIPLVESGVINGANKVLDKGKIVTTFLMGSQALYDFVDYNPAVLIKDVAYTNDPMIICQNPKVTSLNSAIQIDITGQCCADSIGTKIFSGVGGQVDFVYGASRSEGGVSIIALQSETKDGISKIAPTLHLGSGVQTTRNHVQYVATEYGIVKLAGRSMQERAVLLTSIAHPRHREELERAAFERYGAHFNYIKNVTK